MNPYTYLHDSKLWTSNFVCLSITNLLLYASIYMLLPVIPLWLQNVWSSGPTEIMLALSVFGIGMFLPGMFNSFLIDYFKRKQICFWSLLGLCITTYLYPMLETFSTLIVCRLIQGMLFGTATMSIGSTLVIDTTDSQHRTKACIVSSWMCRVGMVLGLLSGVYIFHHFDFQTMIHISLSLGVGAMLFPMFTKVMFRAPLEPNVFSLDRFILPRALYPAISLLPIAMIFGLLITHFTSETNYLFLSVGVCLAFISAKHIFQKQTDSLRMMIGIIFLTIGLMGLMMCNNIIERYASLSIGIGLSLSASSMYRMMIKVPLHCERGTSNNTYQLFWETGVIIGICIGLMLSEANISIYTTSLSLCALVFINYALSLHKWYIKHLNNNH